MEIINELINELMSDLDTPESLAKIQEIAIELFKNEGRDFTAEFIRWSEEGRPIIIGKEF